jgi:hypothetical protein
MANENVTTNDTTQPANTETAVVVAQEKPKTLGQYEKQVESHGQRGMKEWRLAAEALLAIKTHKLWKKAKDADGNAYKTFAAYAEGRFGFKKSYAYDLAKAATTGQLTEGAARAERKSNREPQPLQPHEAAERINKAWVRFQDAAGGFRDRAIENETFVGDFDGAMKVAHDAISKLLARYPAPIEHEPADANPENVKPAKAAKAE